MPPSPGCALDSDGCSCWPMIRINELVWDLKVLDRTMSKFFKRHSGPTSCMIHEYY